MALARSNRLLPVLGGIVLLMTVFVGFKSCSSDNRHSPGFSPRASDTLAPDADTPADTIRTLTARVTDMTAQLEALREENAALRKRDKELRQSLKQEITEDLQANQTNSLTAQTASRMAALQDRLTALSGRVADLNHQFKNAKPANTEKPLPIGRGEHYPAAKVPDAHGFVWTVPLDSSPNLDGSPSEAGGIVSGLLRTSTHQTESSVPLADTPAIPPAGAEAVDKPAPVPYYTVPANATLIGSTGMTALIGRIPVNDQVQDPVPFKVIVGSDNLAANGITIPGIDGMIWSGTAVGDWNLSCVTGRLESATFVFQDGTLRTLTSKGDNDGLGWISDAQGIPCVSGKRITNAAAFLATRIGISAIEAAAEAAAAAQTTTRLGEIGTGTASVTGDIGRYTAGKALSGGAAELRQWLDERLGQSFDAVFVKPGAPLAIHVTQELPIDYDPLGRKVQHETSSNEPHGRTGLD